MPLVKNMLIPLTITGVSAEGNGVGRYHESSEDAGMVVFVPFTAEGDEIICRIVKVSKAFAFGIVEEMTKPSSHRCGEQEADCAAFKKCGGCSLRHIRYESELQYKQQRVADAIQRIGGFNLPVQPIVASERVERYRNKAQYPVSFNGERLLSGFYAQRSHRIVEQADCLLQPEEFEPILSEVLAWAKENEVTAYDESKHKGWLRHVYIRKAEVTGEIMVCLVATSGKVNNANDLVDRLLRSNDKIVSILVNMNREDTNVVFGNKSFALYGESYITDQLCGLTFRLSPLSFYQVNREQAERLYGLVKQYAQLSGTETVLDIYCGTGTIGLTLADKAKQVIGIESVQQAVEDARLNAEMNDIANARFLCADAADAAKQLEQEGVQTDVVVLDPPRKGCSASLVETVSAMNPSRIVYVSCDPATLARDCKLFAENGYLPQSVTPVDMFPRTPHVETVVLLSKG